MDNFKTAHQWSASGRLIRPGQKAAFYLVNPDRTKRRALFSEDQTHPVDDGDYADWVILPVEKASLNVKTKPGSKGYVKVGYDKQKGTTIWCGNDEKLIKIVRQRGYDYDMASHRWYRADRQPSPVADAFEEYGYTVDRDYDDTPLI